MNTRKTEKLIVHVILLIILFGIFIPLGYAYDQAVKEAQAKLIEKGYSPGPVDGFSGKNTIKAIRAFQSDNSLPETGTLDLRTRNALGIKVVKHDSKYPLNLEKTYFKEFSYDELLKEVKKHPKHSGFKDDLTLLQGYTRYSITFDRAKESISICNVKDTIVNSGELEGIMQKQCISKHDSAIALFYMCGSRLFRAHIGNNKAIKSQVGKELKNQKSDYWKKIYKIREASDKVIMICTPII